MTDTHTTALPLAVGDWRVDPAHSSVTFAIRHLGLSKVRGRFDDFDATLSVGHHLDDTHIDAVVTMSSINTNNADRDAHLQSSDFFAVETNPTMQFRSTRITPRADGYLMQGELTIKGITRSIELPVDFLGSENTDTEAHAGFSAVGELRRSDYGIKFGLLPMGADGLAMADLVKFELDLQFTAPLTSKDNSHPTPN